MKTFDVYENSEGSQEAIKKGWSWPGFFFTWIWCFVKGLGGTGLTILLIICIDIFVSMTYPSNYYYYYNSNDYQAQLIVTIIVKFTYLIIPFWLGIRGNNKRRNKLMEYGYKYKSTVQASSPESAISIVINKKIINSEHINNETSSNSSLDEIEKLHNMKEKGIITDEEFDKKKKEILNLDS